MTNRRFPVAAFCALLLCTAARADGDPDRHYQSKTPYRPQQAMNTYEAAPAGYRAVYTEMLARHGSRGLSSMKADLALYNLWLQAEKEQALSALGKELGPAIRDMMRANFVLGYGVAGIGKPGYGNETMQGIAEHTELAQRLHRRLPDLFREAGAAAAGKPRQIVVVTSGKDRAVDSGYFFAQSLVAQQAGLAPLLTYPPSLAPQAETDHASRPAGTDRFLLYFHKLSNKQDQVRDTSDPLYRTYQASQAYQTWLKNDAGLSAKQDAILAQPRLASAAGAVLLRLFTPAFVDGLAQGRYRVANTGTHTYASADGKFSSTLSGDGDNEIAGPTEAALALYELYCIAADMKAELRSDFTRYVPPAQAAVFAEADDALAFYNKGPGMFDAGAVTYAMAQTLRDDFFAEVDAIAKGDLSHAAKLRFSHAEIVIPMASSLGLEAMAAPLPRATLYDYQNSAWRGDLVAPMAANIQWDVYTNGAGGTLVRMLYNERETDFKRACDGAKIAPGSHFYDYARLKACYKYAGYK